MSKKDDRDAALLRIYNEMDAIRQHAPKVADKIIRQKGPADRVAEVVAYCPGRPNLWLVITQRKRSMFLDTFYDDQSPNVDGTKLVWLESPHGDKRTKQMHALRMKLQRVWNMKT